MYRISESLDAALSQAVCGPLAVTLRAVEQVHAERESAAWPAILDQGVPVTAVDDGPCEVSEDLYGWPAESVDPAHDTTAHHQLQVTVPELGIPLDACTALVAHPRLQHSEAHQPVRPSRLSLARLDPVAFSTLGWEAALVELPLDQRTRSKNLLSAALLLILGVLAVFLLTRTETLFAATQSAANPDLGATFERIAEERPAAVPPESEPDARLFAPEKDAVADIAFVPRKPERLEGPAPTAKHEGTGLSAATTEMAQRRSTGEGGATISAKGVADRSVSTRFKTVLNGGWYP